MSNDDLYSVLGVPRTATAAELTERFRFLSHAYHPDKFATEAQRQTAEQYFKKITEAYRVLSDPIARSRYDASRGPDSGSSGPPPRAAKAQPDPVSQPPPKRTDSLQVIKDICIAVVVVVVAIGVAVLATYDAERRQRREFEAEFEASKHRIATSEIEFGDLVLQPGDRHGSFDLVGRLRNHSPRYTLDTVVLTVTMRDRLPSGSTDIVGESTVQFGTAVPPGQARNVAGSVRFWSLPKAIGSYDWSYVVTEIRGR